ncbi:MAG: hypothetical protein QM831_36445 [Kofleriaceae bacterium]
MKRLACVLVIAACGSKSNPTPTPPKTEFGYYLLAMTWAPAQKDQCTLPPQLTLHGLWPNYTEAQAKGQPQAWPQFCGSFAHCEKSEDPSCAPTAPVPTELAAFAPAYVNGTLATHEWSKHGSCTSMQPAAYFQAELAAIKSIPHRDLQPGEMAREDLVKSFGIAPESVVLGCNASCELQQVAFCIAKNDGDQPTTPTPCTTSVTSSDYDNGCAVKHCDKVKLAATCASPATP